MKPKQADKYCNKLVAVTFKESWFNEAHQTWVYGEDEEYFGLLNHCPYQGQERYYQLTNLARPLATDDACWSANRMKRIRVII